MKKLLIEVVAVFILGLFSLGEGIRIVLAKKVQTSDIIGPGFYSVGLGSILIICSLIYFIYERKKSVDIKARSPVIQSGGNGKYNRMMTGMIAIMIMYIILMHLIGYFFASLVFFFLINRVSGFGSRLANLAVTLLMTISFYLIFIVWLGMIFPRGLLFNL